MLRAIPPQIGDYVLRGVERDVRRHMGVEGVYEAASGEERLEFGFGAFDARQAERMKEDAPPPTPVEGLPERVTVYAAEDGPTMLADEALGYMIFVGGGTSDAQMRLTRAMHGGLDEATSAEAESGEAPFAVFWNALPPAAEPFELMEVARITRGGATTFAARYAEVSDTRTTASIVLVPDGSRSYAEVQMMLEMAGPLRSDTTLAGREAMSIRTGEANNGMGTSNDKPFLVVPYDGFYLMVGADEAGVPMATVQALAGALDVAAFDGLALGE